MRAAMAVPARKNLHGRLAGRLGRAWTILPSPGSELLDESACWSASTAMVSSTSQPTRVSLSRTVACRIVQDGFVDGG